MEITRAQRPVRRLLQMEARVRVSERKFAGPRENAGFRTIAPHQAEYASLSPLLLYSHIEELGLDPELPFADLGSGLGAACFAAALYFRRVEGWEYDPRLVMEAERLRQGLGFDNVVFRQGDFLKADLSKYRVLYLFHPFSEDFVPLMAEKMDGLESGTQVITQVFNFSRPMIFTRNIFERVHPLEILPDEVGDDYVTETITFRRR